MYNDVIHLSVNDETTKKLSNVLDIKTYVLQNNNEIMGMILFESGMESADVEGTKLNQSRFIYNFDLFDMYNFVYLDSRFFDGLLSTPTMGLEVKMDSAGNEVSEIQPLTEIKKISMPAPSINYDTYYVNSVQNNIYNDEGAEAQNNLTEFINGPRSCFVPLNFIVNQKLTAQSNGTADIRYDKFGLKAQNLFSDGNLYDYIDTNIMIEGTSTTRTHKITIRIIRFSGT